MRLFGLQVPFTKRNESRSAPSVADDRWFTPSPFVFLGGEGKVVTPESALQFSAVFACVKIISETLASVPLIVYRRRSDGGKDRASEHPLYKLLRNRPNRMKMSGLEFREMLTAHVLLWGNAYAQILRNRNGEPLEVYPLHPSRVRPDFSPTGELVYLVRTSDGKETVLSADEVFHIRGYRDSGHEGLSPVAAFRQAITLGLSLEDFGKNFFEGGAFPSSVLEYDGTLGDEAKKNLRESWQALYGGSSRGKKVAVLEAGLKWKPMGIPQTDAEFLATRRFQVEEIARIYRVPPHMLADLTRSTYSNIEQQSIDFVTYTMLPWFRRWEEAITRDFLGGDDSEVFSEFLIDGLLRGDTLSRFQAYGLGRQWGLYSINDIRVKENMNPIGPEGDVYLSPLNMVPAGDERAPEPGQQGTPDTTPAEAAPMGGRSAAESFRPLLRETFARIARREAGMVASALKKRGENSEKEAILGAFEGHDTFVRECLGGVFTALEGATAGAITRENLEKTLENYLKTALEQAISGERAGRRDPSLVGDYWAGMILGYSGEET